jgi:uncharacterized Zn-finger protein
MQSLTLTWRKSGKCLAMFFISPAVLPILLLQRGGLFFLYFRKLCLPLQWTPIRQWCRHLYHELLLLFIATESSHILDTNEKPYECHCGASFSRRDLLKRHQSTGHDMIPQDTPSTAIHDTSNLEPRTDDSHMEDGASLLEPTSFQSTLAGPTSRDSQFGDGQFHCMLRSNFSW